MNDWDLPKVDVGNWTQVPGKTSMYFLNHWTTSPALCGSRAWILQMTMLCHVRRCDTGPWRDCWWREYKLICPVSFRGRDWIRWVCSSGFALPGQASQHIKCYKWAVSGRRQRSEERKLGRQTLGAGFWHMVLRLNITAHADSVEVHRFMNLEAVENSRRNRCHMS